MVQISGIADEAGSGIERQIAAHRALGWSAIELRTVDGLDVAAALPDEAFDRVVDAIERAGLEVTAFASAIGNWSRHIARDDFQQDVDDLQKAIPRMRRLGVKYIRVMSWRGEEVSEAAWRDEAIRRFRELAALAEEGQVILAHENCVGWGGLGAPQMRELIETVASPHLVALFDIGNTISHGYEPWAFYEGVRDLIGYVHVKDCRRAPSGGRSQDYAHLGEGDAMVQPILHDLLASGYDGVISIEPHIAKVIHHADDKPDAQRMYASYLDYGRRFEAMVKEAARPGAGVAG